HDDRLGKNFCDGTCSVGVELAVEGDNATECRGSIAGQGLAVGVDQRVTLGDSARIGVLDNHASGGAARIEFRYAFIGGIGVVNIVVGELLSLQLSGGRDAIALSRRAVKRRALMRVLAITQSLRQPTPKGAIVGGIRVQSIGE